jgi:hypothetical protein
MANWKYKIELKADSDRCDDGEITIAQLSGIVAEKLKALPCYNSPGNIGTTLLEIVERFADLSEDENAEQDEFNSILQELYDWGDTEIGPVAWPKHRLCWIGFAF